MYSYSEICDRCGPQCFSNKELNSHCPAIVCDSCFLSKWYFKIQMWIYVGYRCNLENAGLKWIMRVLT